MIDALLGDARTGSGSCWRGVHGELFIWDEDSPIYVAYKAGVAIAKASA